MSQDKAYTMPTIRLETLIRADINTCFDLSRSIELHKLSTVKTRETAVAGTVSGLIGMGGSVTWRATHFGIRQQLTSKITAFERPFHFRDEQQQGAFKYMVHDHYFEELGGRVSMRDVFTFRSPGGLPGRLFDRLVLTRYLTRFLTGRNDLIRAYAEQIQDGGKDYTGLLPSALS